ncbi:MAG: hypothetical protein AAGK14_07000 [Verrucomicrobiota bacterium]
MSQKIRRCITFFEKEGEDFIGDITISAQEFETIAEWLPPSEDDPLRYYVYILEGAVLERTRKLLIGRLPDEDHAYFLELVKKVPRTRASWVLAAGIGATRELIKIDK